jgi:hypothetical protein
MTRPKHHFKLVPDDPETGDVDAGGDNVGPVSHHAARLEIARHLLEFVRMTQARQTTYGRLADTALVRRIHQANLRAAALARRVAAVSREGEAGR